MQEDRECKAEEGIFFYLTLKNNSVQLLKDSKDSPNKVFSKKKKKDLVRKHLVLYMDN